MTICKWQNPSWGYVLDFMEIESGERRDIGSNRSNRYAHDSGYDAGNRLMVINDLESANNVVRDYVVL